MNELQPSNLEYQMPRSRWASEEEFWAEVEKARTMTFEEKLHAGPRMFQEQCRVISEALRAFTPYAEEADIREMLTQIVAWRKRVEDRPSEVPPCPNYIR
jgi:hypothetical protein